MKYSKLLDTKVITERQGAQSPRLVQYANDEEINSKRNFLDWDILDAKSVRNLFDYAIKQEASVFIEQSLGDSTIKTISQDGITKVINGITQDIIELDNQIATEINRAVDAETQIKKDLDDVTQKLSSKTVLIEQSDYDALTSYDKDIIYFIYKPIDYTLVDKPIDRTFTYDEAVHTLASTDAYTVTGTGGSEIGVYQFNVSLNFDPVTNIGYKWSDGTTNDIVVTYTINEVSTLVWSFGSSFPIKFS